jgi:peptidoglycan/LPS O-acetylase OafA/YrhL
MSELKTAPPRTARQHLPELDGVRAVAVLIVIAGHFWQTYARPPFHLLDKILIAWGQFGIDLFFVLSGFLITGILLESKGSTHFLRNFYVRRVLRIFPLYYATMAGFYLLAPALHVAAWVPWKQSWW